MQRLIESFTDWQKKNVKMRAKFRPALQLPYFQTVASHTIRVPLWLKKHNLSKELLLLLENDKTCFVVPFQHFKGQNIKRLSLLRFCPPLMLLIISSIER